MQSGDISNEVSPRLLFIFEGTVGTLPSKVEEAKEAWYLRSKRWRKAADMWEIADRAYALLWDVSWRYNYRFDVVTYHKPPFAKALAERFDDEGLPVGRVWASSPMRLARQLAFMPDVKHVYDADDSRLFTYGGRGVHMPGGLAAFTSLW